MAWVWKPLYERFGVHIDFAYRTFRWDSEASLKAHVHCVIIGFSCRKGAIIRKLYYEDGFNVVQNINPYLLEASNIYIENRKKPLCDVPEMITGNRPADGGHLIIEAEDYEEFISKEPEAKKYIKRLIGSAEFINGKDRYCLWLVNAEPGELRKMPEVMKRIEACREDRENAPDEGRRYVPIGFLDRDVIATNLVLMIPDAGLYHFGVLTSNVHMAWMRAVCGRLEMRYRYSKDIVYNNFPWCSPTKEQKEAIEKTAQSILDARNLYPNSSLEDLYDDLTMPEELRKAHEANNRAVMQAYGFSIKDTSEADCVAALMKMYQESIKQGKID